MILWKPPFLTKVFLLPSLFRLRLTTVHNFSSWTPYHLSSHQTWSLPFIFFTQLHHSSSYIISTSLRLFLQSTVHFSSHPWCTFVKHIDFLLPPCTTNVPFHPEIFYSHLLFCHLSNYWLPFLCTIWVSHPYAFVVLLDRKTNKTHGKRFYFFFNLNYSSKNFSWIKQKLGHLEMKINWIQNESSIYRRSGKIWLLKRLRWCSCVSLSKNACVLKMSLV